jgi:hypothetical protein
MAEERKPPYTPPDFVRGRPLELESKINLAFAATFRPDQPAATLVLEYLKTITLNDIVGPGAPDAMLRHKEGQRDLVRIIQNRIDHGRANLPAQQEPKP